MTYKGSKKWSSSRPCARVRCVPWSAIAANYPATVRFQLERLIEMRCPSGPGKLILWHGEPGTGKTSAVLALLERWRDWCSGQVITDPERMFLESDYLNEVLACDPHRPRAALSATPGSIRSCGPGLGAHNREVFGGLLGLSDEELGALRTDRVV